MRKFLILFSLFVIGCRPALADNVAPPRAASVSSGSVQAPIQADRIADGRVPAEKANPVGPLNGVAKLYVPMIEGTSSVQPLRASVLLGAAVAANARSVAKAQGCEVPESVHVLGVYNSGESYEPQLQAYGRAIAWINWGDCARIVPYAESPTLFYRLADDGEWFCPAWEARLSSLP